MFKTSEVGRQWTVFLLPRRGLCFLSFFSVWQSSKWLSYWRLRISCSALFLWFWRTTFLLDPSGELALPPQHTHPVPILNMKPRSWGKFQNHRGLRKKRKLLLCLWLLRVLRIFLKHWAAATSLVLKGTSGYEPQPLRVCNKISFVFLGPMTQTIPLSVFRHLSWNSSCLLSDKSVFTLHCFWRGGVVDKYLGYLWRPFLEICHCEMF